MPITSTQGQNTLPPVVTVELQARNGHNSVQVSGSSINNFVQATDRSSSNTPRVTLLQSMRESFFANPRTQVFRHIVGQYAMGGALVAMPISMVATASLMVGTGFVKGQAPPLNEWLENINGAGAAALFGCIVTGCISGTIHQRSTNREAEAEADAAAPARAQIPAIVSPPAVPQVIVEQPGLNTAKDEHDGAAYLAIGLVETAHP